MHFRRVLLTSHFTTKTQHPVHSRAVMQTSRTFLVACAIASVLCTVSADEAIPPVPTVLCKETDFLLISDLGTPISRCRRCFNSFAPLDSVTVHDNSTTTAAYSIWRLCLKPSGKTMIMARDTDKFLAPCSDCDGTMVYRDPAFVNAERDDLRALWDMETIHQDPEGDIVAFKNLNGKYLARCHKCMQNQPPYAPKDAYFVHESDSSMGHAQFRLVPIS